MRNLIYLIDFYYQGELKISVYGLRGDINFTIKHDERIAQMVFISIV
ncbi:MAG: hypothetical protein ACTS8R_02920 [Arsenophonus sp. NC-QC1-MAG3]